MGTVATYMLTYYDNHISFTSYLFHYYMPTIFTIKLPTTIKIKSFPSLEVRTSD